MQREDYSIDENFQAALVEYEDRPFVYRTLIRLYSLVNKGLTVLIRRRSVGRRGWFSCR